jgi:hypothetical protein
MGNMYAGLCRVPDDSAGVPPLWQNVQGQETDLRAWHLAGIVAFIAPIRVQESARRKLDIRLEKIVAGLREERRIRLSHSLGPLSLAATHGPTNCVLNSASVQDAH